MHNLQKILAAVFLYLGSLLFAQTPNHFIIGADEFSNIDVYSLIEFNGVLYAGTDAGLFEYKHERFEPIPSAANQLGSSIFNLTEYKSQLYCMNLSGQVFKVENGALKLFTTISTDKISSSVNLFANEEMLFVAANHLYAIDSLGKVTTYHKQINQPGFEISYLYRVNNHFNGTIHVTNILGRSISIEGKEVRNLQYYFNDSSRQVYNTISLNGHQYFFYMNGEVRDDNDQKNATLKLEKEDLIYQIDKGTALVTKRKKGVILLKQQKFGDLYYEKIFPDLFISSAIKGKSGLTYFGTFKKGVVVIPRLGVKSIRNEDVNQIAVLGDRKIYLGKLKLKEISVARG